MKSRTTITLLTALCVAESVFIIGLVGGRAAFPPPLVELAQTAEHQLAGSPDKKERIDRSMDPSATPALPSAPADLVHQNQALETKLAEVTKELDARKSEISFSYGSVRESGRFVGMTFRKMFETASAREAAEAQARMADNQINVLSLGPFIQDAEVFESDPVAFAQFQAPLIGEVLGLPVEQGAKVEALLSDLKARSMKVEEGSTEWIALNDTALQGITALLTGRQRQTMAKQIDFFREYGVLVIPAYSILRAPTPTVVKP